MRTVFALLFILAAIGLTVAGDLIQCTQQNEEVNINGARERKCFGLDLYHDRSVCICQDGFVREPSGACVREADCPCPENEAFKHGGACEDSCGDTGRSQRICRSLMMGSWGCMCKPGYVRDPKAGDKCILPTNCTDKICAENEIYSYADCETACNRLEYYGPSPYCAHTWGCHCKPGFVRQGYECIPTGKCKVINLVEPFFNDVRQLL